MAGRNERSTVLERQIVDLVRAVAPPGWRRADVSCRATVAVHEVALTVLTGDGKVATAENPPPELADLLVELRRAHYLSEQGTWFSMVFHVEPETARPFYNFDFDPGWQPPIPPECWRRDQTVLPRDGGNLPAWLRDRMSDREPEYPIDPAPLTLNPVEQMEVLSDRLSVLLAVQVPALWERAFGYYQAAGEHVEFPPLMVQLADGRTQTWTPPRAAAVLLDRLRAGTHGFQGSTWSRIDFEILYEDGGVRCRAAFTHDEEPDWGKPPSIDDVRRELERFPRDRVPEWMSRTLGGVPEAVAPVTAPAEGVRKARVFDRLGPDGEGPSVSRPAVPEEEVERVVAYLRGAPVVLAARSYAPDQLDPARGDRVPLTFHTDGTWVWSGAVGYYLAEHGLPPEPDLVEHIRAGGFRVPEVDETAMDAANAAVTGRSAPEPVGKVFTQQWLTRLSEKLEELGVDPGSYRIRETAEGAWCLVEEGRWSVFRLDDGERYRESVFDEVGEAAAHLLGSVLLVPRKRRDEAVGAQEGRAGLGATQEGRVEAGVPQERRAEPVVPAPPVPVPPVPAPPVPVPPVPAPPVPAPPVPAPPVPEPEETRQQWMGETIQPLPGEPPLTLFRERQMVELQAGTMLDRFGETGGNLVYAAHTPFERRSLPPDWAGRPYHLYRVERPMWVLTGVAVPWFEQPGGGVGYVLSRSVGELLGDGGLVEVFG
ncbi:TNT domain-containing protein [Actinomadura hibisca]|uniref:TNT domain-containing protein n=1 Tax=Actinomadura hibisca TaxID=68565 RepID=UPI00082C6DE3|nr:TNT domain-containing protein [Actinomadura hibisca]